MRARLAISSLVLLLLTFVTLSAPRRATAVDGCFTFRNSVATAFSDPDAPDGVSWYCAGQSSQDCQDCLYEVDEGDGNTGQAECVGDETESHCEQFY
jgi:hypothetical protein